MALILRLQQHDGQSSSWDAAPVDGYSWLLVGSLSAAESHGDIATRNVTRLLTVAGKLEVARPPPCVSRHVTVDIEDHPIVNLLEVLGPCLDCLDAAAADAEGHEDGGAGSSPPPRILVHCASGISRSVSSIVAWIMIRKGRSLEEALASVRVHRPLANPNVGFMQQLLILEKNGGDLAAARKEWTAHSQKDVWELIGRRRILANELHSQADELEVRTQKFVSSALNHLDEDDVTSSTSVLKGRLHQEATSLSNKMKKSKAETDGLPTDKVTSFIFNSATKKVDRLLDLILGQEQGQGQGPEKET